MFAKSVRRVVPSRFVKIQVANEVFRHLEAVGGVLGWVPEPPLVSSSVVTDVFDEVETLDALADMLVVVEGARIQLGLCGGVRSVEQLCVGEFMEVFGQRVRWDVPVEVGEVGLGDECLLRTRLIFEESLELLNALGVKRRGAGGVWVDFDPKGVGFVSSGVAFDAARVGVVLEGFVRFIYCVADALGMPVTVAVTDYVHPSNMSKLDVDGSVIYDAGGKVLKGPNFVSPDLADCLAVHR